MCQHWSPIDLQEFVLTHKVMILRRIVADRSIQSLFNLKQIVFFHVFSFNQFNYK